MTNTTSTQTAPAIDLNGDPMLVTERDMAEAEDRIRETADWFAEEARREQEFLRGAEWDGNRLWFQ